MEKLLLDFLIFYKFYAGTSPDGRGSIESCPYSAGGMGTIPETAYVIPNEVLRFLVFSAIAVL